MTSNLFEKIAEENHRRWAHFVKYLCANGYMKKKAKVLDWLKQARTPYKELSEEDKDKDRKFAIHVMELIKEEGV